MDGIIHKVLEDRESDGAHTCANQLLLRVVESGSRQEQRESFQPIIEEKVYCRIVETQDHSLEKVNEVVRELVILRKLELIGDQV